MSKLDEAVAHMLHEPNAPRLLVVGTDLSLAQAFSTRVCRGRYVTETCDSLEVPAGRRWNLAIIDWDTWQARRVPLPQAVRKVSPCVEAIAIAGSRSTVDEIRALNAGAHAYISRPFDWLLVEARICAALRRHDARDRAAGRCAVLNAGPFRVDQSARSVRVDGAELRLTGTLFKLFMALFDRIGMTVERSVLVEEMLGTTTHVTANCLDQHVRRLRLALGPRATLLKSCRGVGYRLELCERGHGAHDPVTVIGQ